MSEAPPARFTGPSSCFDKPDYSTTHMDAPDDLFNWNWELPDGGDGTSQLLSDDSGAMTLLDPRLDKQTSSSWSGASTTATEASLLPMNVLPNSDGEDGGGKERIAHLMSLCRMTHRLETHLRSRTASLDEIMKVNKACLADVVRLTSGKQKGKLCRCSFIMITTCLDIMLVLFEDVVRSSGLDPRGGGGAGAVPRSDMARVPSFHFGVFELDPQEQLAITRRILARELQNYRDVVRTLAVEFQEPSADFFRKLMGQWCLTLTTRLGQLPVGEEKAGGATAGSSPYGQEDFLI